MPAPLPKPAAPNIPQSNASGASNYPAVPPQQSVQVTGNQSGSNQVARPNQPLAPAPVRPTQPQPVSQPVTNQPTQVRPPVVAAPTPLQPAIPQVAAPRQVPQIPAARPVGIPNAPAVTTPQPLTTQQPVRLQQPPQTLTALSSMASNRLPSGAGTTVTSPASGGINSTTVRPLTNTPQSPKGPELVAPKKSILRFLPYIGGGLLLLLILGFVAFRFFGSSAPSSVSNTGTGNNSGTTGSNTSGTGSTATTGKQVSLEYWGLWEPSETMTQVIKDYQDKNPGVTIKYNKQSHKDYRTRVQSAMATENGPDIFRFHASWVPMLKENLAPLPSAIMSTSDFQNTFYPAAVQQLQSNGQLVGIPLMYDGLALYYNTEIFKTAVLEPPKSWSDLRTSASKLTIKEGTTIKRAGIALGNATNVEHFSDVLGILMLQNGADLTKPMSKEVGDSLVFYSNFVKADKVWDDSLPSSTIAFARGDAAMMFAPSWRAHEIKTINPDLKFATVPLPQLSDKRIGWASYWAEGVSNKSKNKDEAWKFIKYLSSKEIQQKLYASQAQTRSFGELYSRKDLADELAKDPMLAAFAQDAPYATGWYLNSYTHDAGLNDQLIQYYQDAVTSLIQGKNIDEVQKTLDAAVSQIVRQYGVTSQTTAK